MRELLSAFDDTMNLITLSRPKGGQVRRDPVIIDDLFHLAMEGPHDPPSVRRKCFLSQTLTEPARHARGMHDAHALA